MCNMRYFLVAVFTCPRRRAKRNVLVTDRSKVCPRIVTRAEWGARPPKKVENIKEPIPKIFIHHTATPPCTTKEACSRLVRSIQNFHMDTRGCMIMFIVFLFGVPILEANTYIHTCTYIGVYVRKI